MTHWDVIIVGGGPAGSMAAKYLAAGNKRVLIIERMQPPRDKVCSGIISTEAVRILKKEFGSGLPSVLCVDPPKGIGIRLKMPQKDDFITQPYEFFNVWRRTFDYWLLLKASEEGAEIQTRTEMVDLKQEENAVTLTVKTKDFKSNTYKKYQISADAVIAADGGSSRIRKILYPEMKSIHAHAYQEYWTYDNVNLDMDYFHAFVTEDSPIYESVWIKDGMLIITTGATSGREVLANQERFIHYLQDNFNLKLKKKIRAESIYQDIGSFSECNFIFGKDRVLLVGEAARLMDIFGQGIPAALQSGKGAALAILDTDSEMPLIDRYQNRLRKYVKSLKRNWKVLRQMGQIF
ncbi:MAG: NAD(P)/FAD-dependent oxidoreductase [Candidatus Helarchaeota archaeon]